MSKSQEASGTVDTHETGNSWKGTFTVDDVEYLFSATMNPNVSAFTISDAKLHYNDTEDLTGSSVDYYGTVGKELNVTLENGVTITGSLEVGTAVYPETNIVGSGTWNARPAIVSLR
ncbi:uncharacterized protein PHACADRAFT_263163 [Phanerochaete carnosa HHB-10118-sp]|uniref:Uncharacterized protein n=1 Tax=Phanerochaete carnosa (strain HHB-10118-sp) TaxID=650164 RepID=K5VIQ1_PHACS|nr:uncharacterized protein PHACADRAFT_263163 [Phanerochaete carnosa HHB-10118-sp]EKM51163.1 hypothetical protein PHACADRAFT_263163 [Phanerochaete carnosa HHB-10118-sp]